MAAIWLLALAILVLLTRASRRLRGTTMHAPCLWCCAAVLLLAMSEQAAAGYGELTSPGWVGLLRYVAAIGTLCPIIAVLGAKRPQDRGWQWVVLTLWIVLAMPVVHAAVTQTGSSLELHVAWKMLLVGTLVMQALNYFAGPFVVPVLLTTTAQTALLWPHLSTGSPPSQAHAVSALFLCFLAVALATVIGHRLPGGNSPQELWQKFTNFYGTFWTYRVMGLINQAAEAERWPVSLYPRGFYQVPLEADRSQSENQLVKVNQFDAELEAKIFRALRVTLRRFLDPKDLDQESTQ